MSKNSLNLNAGKRLYTSLLKTPAAIPFTFEYDGVRHAGLGDFKARRVITEEPAGQRCVTTARVDDRLKITVDAFLNTEYGETEYTVYFTNTGKKPTGVLSQVNALDIRLTGDRPVLRGNLGDHDNWYAAYEHDLSKGDKYFLSTGGRATHIVFPYFDLVHGSGGTMLALGWAGTWEALFSSDGGTTHVRAKTDISLNAALMPGETIRTGLIVMLPYKSRNYDDATNLWREWYMKYNLPAADAQGHPLAPLSTAGFASDTGLPNSDGSISERSFTWKPTLDKLITEDVVPDFRWFDAGWYCDPYGKTVETDWWGTTGTWELDRDKWPGDSFRESNEACHRAGMKVLAWFEPERVTHVDGLVANYGYREEWSIGEGPVRTNDLGNPDCLAWTLGRITKMMDENGVDMYREDNNSDPGYAWPYKDGKETQKFGLPRWGMAENLCIVGHYRLWDGIIDYCRRAGKCTFVDSCASGGGRNDIESMRRGFPLMRSDYDRTTSSMRLSQTSTLCRWIPFHGSSTKETATQLESAKGAGSSPYVSRASLLPIYNYGGEFTHNPELDFDLMRRNLNEWKSVRHLLTRDMYVLTPWHHEFDREGWTAFAYDAPEAGESILLAFRMEDCESADRVLKLPFAKPDRQYTLRDADTGETVTRSGRELLAGIRVHIAGKKESKLLYITY